VIGRVSLKFPHLDFTDRLDFDRGDGTLRRNEIYVTGTYDRSSLQVAYVQLPAEAQALGLPIAEQEALAITDAEEQALSLTDSQAQITGLTPTQALTQGLPAREQINVQGDINFYENWQAFAAIERDLLAGQMLDTEYGIGYEDECLAISVAYRRKYTFDAIQGVPPSTSIVLRFSLKTGDQPPQPFSLFPQNVFSTSHP
jgi:LPS-assembly protein